MKAKLSYLSERQSVLAQNVANADTPGYKAKDVVPPDFLKMAKNSMPGVAGGGSVQKLHMTTTSSKHLAQNMASATSLKVIKRATTDELNPDGNNVVIEEEMSKVAANQLDYQKVLNLYSKAITMFKTAIGNPGTSA